MIKRDIVIDIFKEQIIPSSIFKEIQCFGSFENSTNNDKVLKMFGSVYGFVVELSEKEKNEIFKESKEFKTNNLKCINDWSPIKGDIYPLYWGKDINGNSRIYQHIKNTKKTGLIRLCAYKSLIGKIIYCGSIVVNDYKRFEIEMNKQYPHLLKTSTKIL